MILRERDGIGTISVGDPDLAFVRRSEQRRRRPVRHNLPSIARQLVACDGEAAVGDPRLRFRRDADVPEMRLLVVLVVGVDVISRAFAGLLVCGLRLGRLGSSHLRWFFCVSRRFLWHGQCSEQVWCRCR